MDIYTLQKQCKEKAVDQLKSMGIMYPVYDSSITNQANYMRLIEYRMRESALIIEYMTLSCSPKKASNDGKNNKYLEPRKLWGAAYNDK